jgi:hypothetical protein
MRGVVGREHQVIERVIYLPADMHTVPVPTYERCHDALHRLF